MVPGRLHALGVLAALDGLDHSRPNCDEDAQNQAGDDGENDNEEFGLHVRYTREGRKS